MRRHQREQAANDRRSAESPLLQAAMNELQSYLDDEIERLAEKYRAPFILCCLEGKSRAEAAQALGWEEGTLSTRLAKAREILQKRLIARGVTLSAALAAVAISPNATSAVSTSLANATTDAALAFAGGNAAGAISAQVVTLAQRVLQGMLIIKLKIGAALTMSFCLSVSAAGVLILQPGAADGPKKITLPNPPPHVAKNKSETKNEQKNHSDIGGGLLPEGALLRLGSNRMQHGEAIRASALSSGGLLATASERYVLVWSGSKIVHRFPCEQAISHVRPSLVFAPEESHLAYFHGRQFAYIWDLRTGKEWHRFEWQSNDGLDEALGSSCRFMDQGKELLFCTHGSIRRFRLDSKQIVASVAVTGARELSLDGRTFFRIENDVLILGDAVSGKELARFDAMVPHEDIENGLAYSPYRRSFALIHDRREIQHRELPSGKVLASFPLPKSVLDSAEGGKIPWKYRLAFPTGGRMLLMGTSQGAIHRWDLTASKELPSLHKHGGEVAGMHALPDSQTLISTGADGIIRSWDLATGRNIPQTVSNEEKFAAAYSADGRWVAIGDRRGRVDLWDARRGQLSRTLQREGTVAAQLAFDPESKLLTMAERSGSVKCWQIPTAAPGAVWQRQFGAREEHCDGIHFSPDGRLLCINDYPRQIRVVEVETKKVLWQGPGAKGEMFAPDGATFVIAEPTGPYLSFVDTKTWKKRSTVGFKSSLPEGLEHSFTIAFAPDGNRMAVILNGESLALCNGRTGEETQHLANYFRFDEQNFSVRWADERENLPISVAFSADGKWIASGGTDTDVCIWEAATGRIVLRLSGHEAAVSTLAFSPDGRTIFSFGQEGQGYIWNLMPKSPADPRAPLTELWVALCVAESAEAYGAQWWMIARSTESVTFLRDRLKPIPFADEGKVQQWITDLSSDTYAVRDAASRELLKVGEPVQTPIRKALQGDLPLETRRRLKQVLDTVANNPRPEALRTERAIMVLERIGSPEARSVLETLARGASGAQTTEEAAAALKRLAKRPMPSP